MKLASEYVELYRVPHTDGLWFQLRTGSRTWGVIHRRALVPLAAAIFAAFSPADRRAVIRQAAREAGLRVLTAEQAALAARNIEKLALQDRAFLDAMKDEEPPSDPSYLNASRLMVSTYEALNGEEASADDAR